jgi:DNA primase
VIVEGYLDVIALHQAGYCNVVSPMGTAITEDQLRLLKKFTRRIVLALDPDTAGQKAVLRGLEAARQAMDHETDTGFDARGLLRHEARLQADLRVASLPDELDPDEIVLRDTEEWARLITQAKPVVTHVMEALAADQDLNDPKVKSKIAAQVLPLIEDLPNPVERDTYRQQLARLLKVDERTIIGSPVHVSRRRRVRQKDTQPVDIPVVPEISPAHRIEAYCLGILFQKPELLYRLDRMLQEAKLGALSNTDFEYTDFQILLNLIRQSLEQSEVEPQQYVTENMPDALVELPADILDQDSRPGQIDERLLEELQRSVIKMRRLSLSKNINSLRFLEEEAQQQGDLRATFYHGLVFQHTRSLRDLDKAESWLSSHRSI